MLGCSTDWQGETCFIVREVYRRVINLESADGKRFSLITDEGDFLPRSLWVSQLPDVEAGQQVLIVPAVLRLFDPVMPPPVRYPNERWSALLGEWHEFLDEEDLLDVRDSLEKEGIFSLCGLGPGATPAGDDYISGWITAHKRIFGIKSPEISAFYLKWKPASTTWLSGWIIRDALDGKIWSRGKKILEALDGDSSSQLQEALGAVLSWGHTSGLAWLAGLGDGLKESLRKKEQGRW